MVKIIYLRVSNKDLSYEDQLPFILNKFKLQESECLILTEKISAFNEEAQKKRAKFIRLKEMIEEGKVEELYVYKVDRLERNMKRLFSLYFNCEANDCRIYSAEEPMLNMDFEDSAQGEFLRYINVLLFGTQAQGESENTSKRTSKAVVNGDITTSSYGNKWGAKYKDLEGNPVDDLKVIECMRRRIKFLLDVKKLRANDIVQDIAKKFKVQISVMTVSRVKNGKT
jgi:DNA invertase Pin-like site-specific DNA recombinase